ncbi:MAG: YdcF family protein [Candidatus Kaiserbacteria bacterium]|nr:YdcF family protein [Candidatus Kaiserbacteria bacterium]
MAILTAVHVSGYSLAELRAFAPKVKDKSGAPKQALYDDWQRVMWGGVNLPGRIPMGIYMAHHTGARKLIWSTGASWVDGMSEAEYTMFEAIGAYELLRKNFPAFFGAGFFKTDGDYRMWIQGISVAEQESRNTAESFQYAVPIIDELVGERLGELIVVTSENHIERTMRDAISVMRHGKLPRSPTVFDEVPAAKSKQLIISGTGSFTGYAGLTASETYVRDLGQPTMI